VVGIAVGAAFGGDNIIGVDVVTKVENSFCGFVLIHRFFYAIVSDINF
jgi:hypothetical protein